MRRSNLSKFVLGGMFLMAGAGVSHAVTVVQYDFEDGANLASATGTGTIHDVSGHNFHGNGIATDGDNPTYSAGGAWSGSNMAMSLIGNPSSGGLGRDRITMGDIRPEYKPGSNSFTWEVFIKAPTTLDFRNSIGYIVNMLGADSGQSHIGIAMYGEANSDATKRGKVQFTIAEADNNATGKYQADSPTALNDGNWHHLAMVRDNVANTIKFYVDYNSVATFTDAVDRNIGVFTEPLRQPVFGSVLSGDINNGVELTIDDFRISDTALTPGQFIGAVPEPTSLGLLGGGVMALMARRRRR